MRGSASKYLAEKTVLVRIATILRIAVSMRIDDDTTRSLTTTLHGVECFGE
jgi:hypothetical protein